MQAFKLTYYDENFAEPLKAIYSNLKPVDRLSGSEWAEKYRFVSFGVSALPGRWNNETVPFLMDIADAMTSPLVERVSFMKSAQVGGTEIILNTIGYYIHIDPSSMLVLQPTLDMARAFSKSKLDPMLRDTPALSSKIKTSSRDKDNSILHKNYIGGELDIAGGNSPNSLAMRSKRISIADDVDRIPASAGDEGDPVQLAEKRTTTFFNRKNINVSTPTVSGESRIEKLYNLSDRRKFHVPCPHCEHKQTLKFKNLIWDKETDMFGEVTAHLPETVKYACENCGNLLTEKDKHKMLKKGIWIAENPLVQNHAGFWINELYSPFSSWEKIVRDFLSSKDDPQKLRVFTNTTLGEVWQDEEKVEINEHELLERVEDYLTGGTIPNEILLVTAGIDQQDDRSEIYYWGFGLGKESWLLGKEVVYGNPVQTDFYNEIDHHIFKKSFIRKDGKELKIIKAFYDSGGHYTQEVYNYTKRRYPRMQAIKGRSGYGFPLLLNVSKVGKLKDVLLQNLCADTGKEIIFRSLQVKEGPRTIHFDKSIADYDFFQQLTAEKIVKKYNTKNGYEYVWVKKSKHLRNEALDCFVYALAAMESMKPNFEKIKNTLENKIEPTVTETKPEIKPTQRSIYANKKSNWVV